MLLYTKFSFKLPVYSTSCKIYISPCIHYLFQHIKTNKLKTIKNICTICVYLFLTVRFRFNGPYSFLWTVWTAYLSTKIKFICESSEKKVNIKSNFLQVKRFLEFQWIQITPATAFPMNALALLTKSSICIMNWPGGWMAWFKLSWDLLA